MGDNRPRFMHILTPDFLRREWITNRKTATAIGLELGCSKRPVLRALAIHGITLAEKPRDLTTFLDNGQQYRFRKGHKPRPDRPRCTIGWKGHTKETHPTAAKISASKMGKPYPLRGPTHHNWKGGVTPETVKQRNSRQYADWRLAVWRRDKFTCQRCGAVGGRKLGKGKHSLHAHHIQPWCDFPDLRFEVSNGETLCVPCHAAIPHKGHFRRVTQT